MAPPGNGVDATAGSDATVAIVALRADYIIVVITCLAGGRTKSQ